MILHALSIRGWKAVHRLELDDIGGPLTVLHGPNRTGKSSIVEAIRCCLFDYDHDSNAAAIRSAVPWTNGAVPEVVVEFEVAGARYRLMKRFSSRKDGDALLEKNGGGRWSVLERGKEASRRTRQLLEVEKSDTGLNQLLWLPQGATHVPDSGSLDVSLRKRFETVLGSLLTAQDVDFHELLQERCRRYFSLKTGKESRKSPVSVLRDELRDAAARVEELQRKVAESESLVRKFDTLREQSGEERARVLETRRQLEELRTANDAVANKRAELADARRRLETAEEQRDRAQTLLDEHAVIRQKLVKLEQTAQRLLRDQKSLEESREGIADKIAKLEAERQAVRDELGRLDERRAELGDRRRLVEVAERTERIRAALDAYGKLDERLTEFRRQLGETVAADEKSLKQLEANRKEAATLRAELEAAAIRVEIAANEAAAVELSVDSEAAERHELAGGESLSRSFRQRTELTLGSFVVRVSRGQQDLELDDAARRLAVLDADFRDALAGLNVEPDDERWLATLLTRNQRREHIALQIADIEEQRCDVAPDGGEALQHDLDGLQATRRSVLDRSPALGDWQPDAEHVRRFEHEVESTLAEQRGKERLLSKQLDELKRQDASEHDKLLAASTTLSGCTTEGGLLHGRLERLGSEFTLQQNLKDATARVEEARAVVERSTLTPDEEQLEEKIDAAEQALERRQSRLQESELEAEGIRGQLRDRAGLHDQLAAAEAELTRLETDLEREEVELAAHRLLLETFESCRDERVERTVGPLERQLSRWTARLGLDDYRAVDFGANGYLPTGLKRHDAEKCVDIGDESFGTIEQLSLLIRLGAGRLLARGERQVAILDDPLTHADSAKHRAMLDILEEVVTAADDESAPLQLLVFTCHPERFDHLRNARHVDLVRSIQRNGHP